MVSIPIGYLAFVIFMVVVLTSIVSIFIYRQRLLRFQKEQSAARDENALENQFLKGKIYGEQETLKKLNLILRSLCGS